MKEQFEEQIKMMNELLDTLIEDDTLFPKIAKLLNKLHLALMAEGFSEEQATRIVANYKPTGSG